MSEQNEALNISETNEGQEVASATAQSSDGAVIENVKFNFKARKATNEKGEEIGKLPKQPTLILGLPKLTPAQLISYLSLPEEEVPAELNAKGEVVKPAFFKPHKIVQLIVDTVFDNTIRAQVKAQLEEIIDSFGADPEKKISADQVDYDKLSLEFIASLEPGQRGLAAIPEEDYNTFYQDYTTVIMQVTGKDVDRVQKHIEIYKRPTKIRYNKEAQKALIDSLDLYKSQSPAYASEDTMQVADRLYSRLEKWYKESDAAVANAL